MTTVALNKDTFEQIITTMQEGIPSIGVRPNTRCAAALMIEASLCLRIGDVLSMKLSSIVRDGSRYRLDIVEEKTGKKRVFTVPDEVYNYLLSYAVQNGLKKDDLLFNMTVRAVQKHLKIIADYLGLENVSTHSFRKYGATDIYEKNGHDSELVREILQHSSIAITQRYLGIRQDRIENALKNSVHLL